MRLDCFFYYIYIQQLFLCLHLGKDDFKLDKFKASSSEYLETYYGEKNDGNVLDPANLDDLEKFVKERTRGSGVQLVMCDGGFSVEG